jgi:hypothetical protein
MPEVNTETVHRVNFTNGDIDRLQDGKVISVELSDGSSLKLYGPDSGDGSDHIEAGNRNRERDEDVDEEEIEKLVQESKKESRGGIIEKNPDQPDDVERV